MDSGLPCRVRTALRFESLGAHTHHMTQAKANVSNSASIVRHSMARQVDEMSPASAAAVKKILALP